MADTAEALDQLPVLASQAVMRRPLEPTQFLLTHLFRRLADNGIVASVGSKGDSYDNTMIESFNGLYKWEMIYNRGSWSGLGAALDYVAWFNHRRLHGEITPTHTTASETDHYLQPAKLRPKPPSAHQNLYGTQGGSQCHLRRAATYVHSSPAATWPIPPTWDVLGALSDDLGQ